MPEIPVKLKPSFAAGSRLKRLAAVYTDAPASAAGFEPVVLPQPTTSSPTHIAQSQTHSLDNEGYLEYDASRVYAPGDRIKLPLRLVVSDKLDPRYFALDNDSYKSLLTSLAAQGQLQAAQVYPAVDGRFSLKSGGRRTRGLKQLGEEFIKVEVVKHSSSPWQDYKEARTLNVEQKEQSHIDDALRWKQLIEDSVIASARELCSELNLNEGEVSKSLSIATLPLPVLEKMAYNIASFGLTAAYLVFQYWKTTEYNQEITLKLVSKVAAESWSVRKLEAFVKNKDSEGSSAAKKRGHALHRAELNTDKGQGELKAFKGKVTLEVAHISDELRDALYDRLEEVALEFGLISIKTP